MDMLGYLLTLNKIDLNLQVATKLLYYKKKAWLFLYEINTSQNCMEVDIYIDKNSNNIPLI